MSYNSNDTYGVFVVLECYLGAVRAVRVPGPGDQAYRVPGQQSRVSVQHSQAHLTAGAVTYIRNCMKYFWFRSPTQLLIQGQWWSILLTQCLQILQCATVQSELCIQGPPAVVGAGRSVHLTPGAELYST